MNNIWEWHKKKIDWWKAKLGLDWYGVAWVSFFKGVLIVFLICILTGCTIGEKKIKLLQVEEPRQKLNLPDPMPLTLEDIRWIIITSDNAEEVFKKLEEAGIDPVLFGLTDKDYELLSKNFAQIRQKLQETNSLLEEYKKYYEGEENADSN
tara:strand:- start:191 stop:643 length:453 start_codon:yes stop_codon:yes gene_type:complete